MEVSLEGNINWDSRITLASQERLTIENYNDA
jgi:hypothetical protein